MTRILLLLALVPALIFPPASVSAAEHGAVSLNVSLALAGSEHPPGATLVTVSNNADAPVHYVLRIAGDDRAAAHGLEAVVHAESDGAVLYRGPASGLAVDSAAAIAPGTSVTYIVATQWTATADGHPAAPGTFCLVADGLPAGGA